MNNPPPPQPGQPTPYVAPASGLDEGPNSKSWSGCLAGCLVGLGICTVLCAGVGFYAFENFSRWAIVGARATASGLLKDSGLPIEEREAILIEFDRVTAAYEKGDITLEEMGEITKDLVDSPLVGAVVVQAIEMRYLSASSLSLEEQENGKRTLARVIRGVVDEKIAKQEIDQLSHHVLTELDLDAPKGQGQQQLRATLSDEELRSFFAEAQAMVDAKEIPDDDVEFEMSHFIRRAVDRALEK